MTRDQALALGRFKRTPARWEAEFGRWVSNICPHPEGSPPLCHSEAARPGPVGGTATPEPDAGARE
jgi:hypothetical protein